MSLITPTQFENFTVAFYSGVSPYQADGQTLTSDGQTLLDNFNALLAKLPADQKATPDQVNALYLQFLAGALSTENTNEATNALSVEELASRQAIFAVYSLCVQMLQALQGTMKTQGDLLDIYTDWQSNYTDMIAQIPMYGPEIANHIIADSTDFGDTTLGYAGLTVTQVLQYLVSDSSFSLTTAPSSNVSKTWQVPLVGDSYCDNAAGAFSVTLTEDTSGNFSVSIGVGSWQIRWSDGGMSSDFLWSDSITPTGTSSGQSQSYDLISKLTASLTTQWNVFVNSNESLEIIGPNYTTTDGDVERYGLSMTTQDFAKAWSASNPYSTYDKYYTNNDGDQKVHDNNNTAYWGYMFSTGVWGPESEAWPETLGPYDESPDYDDDDEQSALQNAQNAEYSYRAEVNAQLQLYLTTAKSRSDNISAYSQQTQNVISQAQQSIQAQADLLKSIIDTLSTLLSAVFT